MITAEQLHAAYKVAQDWRDEKQTNPVPVSLDPEFLERMAAALLSVVKELLRDEHLRLCENCQERGKIDLQGEPNDPYCKRWEELK